MAAADVNFEHFVDPLLILGTAGVVVPMARRLGVSPVLAYLAAGALIGPQGLGSLKYEWPLLRWLTIRDAQNVAGFAELGVVFLLFLVGLELSFERLATMRRLVLGLGGLQVAITAAAIFAGLMVAGMGAPAALVLGLCLALSSTAIVLEVLSRARRMATAAGRASFAVLLAQDLAVIPLFLLISALSVSDSGGVIAGLATALLQAGVALVAIVLVGRFLLRPLYRLVAAPDAAELFIAATLLVVVGAGVSAAAAGLSMALGSFVAGLMLAETEYRKQIEAVIDPFKSLMLGVFFFTIGMRIDVRDVLAQPLAIMLCAVALVVLKSGILLGLMRLFRVPRAAAMEASLTLGPGGEFAFVGVALAISGGIVTAREGGFVLAVTALGMAFIPALHRAGRMAGGLVVEPPHTEPPVPPESEEGHTIVVGHGRVGRVVADMLERHGRPYLATDSDASTVAAERRRGRPVYLGNATQPGYLERCGLDRAKALVLTIHDQRAVDEIVVRVRKVRPDITIVARARDAEHARHLYAVGVTDAVPETIEASLQLSEAVLVGIGVAVGPVIAAIHEKRDEVRRDLQEAARGAGQDDSRSIRASTRP
ncbi:MAG: cation:proton antiporter, partial [Hyphomicrobiaceae bacterium]